MRIEIKNIEAQYNLILQQNKTANFDLVISGSTRKILHEGDIYTNMVSNFSLKELIFIKKVRNDIIKNCTEYEAKNGAIPNHQCSYVDWDSKLPFNCSKVCEIDLNAAYWEMAFQCGYISPAIYNEGFNFRKKIRLVSLGSIAKNEKTVSYRNGEFHSITEFRHKYAKVFFNISRYIYDIMNICKGILGKNYLFFWVDAIFFINEVGAKEQIFEILQDSEMNYKTYLIDNFNFDAKKQIVTITSGEHKNQLRQFNLKKEMKF